MRITALSTLIVAFALAGCRTDGPSSAPSMSPAAVQAESLLGRPLRVPPLDAETRAERERQLAEARERWEQDPRDEHGVIWLGRRQAYLGHYDDAIDTYTAGLRQHRDSYRLLRHRGHRWITIRKLGRAVTDLEAAAAIIERGVPDEVEPDGMPNASNQPRSTTHTNIYYHLGLARFLRGEYADALDAYERCLAFADNDDMLVATVYWLHLSLLRLDERERSDGVLAAITPEMEIIENDAYHRLLLLFKGAIGPDELTGDDGDGIQSATALYGLANWHLREGRDDAALDLLERLAASEAWPAFGVIAAEADLAGR